MMSSCALDLTSSPGPTPAPPHQLFIMCSVGDERVSWTRIRSSVGLFLLQVGILEGVYHLAMAEEIGEHLPNMTDAMAGMQNVSCYLSAASTRSKAHNFNCGEMTSSCTLAIVRHKPGNWLRL